MAREKKVPYIVSLTDFGATTFLIPANINPVSYTHLTLPTIYSV